MDDINHPIAKVAVAASAFVSLTWIDWLTTTGKVAAAITAIAILGEWLWKRAFRPFARYMGWMRPAKTFTFEDLE